MEMATSLRWDDQGRLVCGSKVEEDAPHDGMVCEGKAFSIYRNRGGQILVACQECAEAHSLSDLNQAGE